MNRIKQLWFPIAILAIIVLTVGWVLAMVVYPSNLQNDEQVIISTDPPTPTTVPTEAPTSTPSPSVTPNEATSTPTPTPDANCTYTMEFWKANTDAWLIENIVLGNRSYNIVEAIAILESEDPAPTERLLAAFFTALLNTLNGADSGEIDPVMVAARDWLILRPHGIDLSEADILELQGLADQLEEYNSGFTGPGLCDDGTITPTPQETSATPTLEATFTQTQEMTSTRPATSTSVPGGTLPRPTATATKDSGGKPKPTKTPPPPPPTNTQPPQPTNTPKPTATKVPPTLAPTQDPEG